MKIKCRRISHLLSMVSGIILAATMLMASADCRDISINSDQTLNLGMIRTQPETRGFMELDPRSGIALSARGVAHSGPYGAASIRVSGPVGTRVTLQIEAQRESERRNSRLSLSEIIVRSGALSQRLPADGGEVTIELPSSGNAEGISQRRVEFGAVVRFRGTEDREQVKYRLIPTCVRTR